MKQELMDAIQEMPVIAAVKDDAGLCSALTNENIRVVFVLYGDICNISSIVRRIHEAGRFAVVHIDLIAGLAGKEVAVDFIRNTTEADGIISTRQSFIRRAKELGLAAILRVFLLDFIAEHYAEPLTLDALAEQVNEKAGHVSYLFYKYKNIRPIDYLINYRVRIATELLRSGDYTVTQAAHEVGYRDACYFSRIYKKRMGFPPTRILP